MKEQIEFFISIFPDLWEGLIVSLNLSVGALLLGFAVGLPMAIARVYGKGAVRKIAGAYIEAIRGTPMVVQLFIVYFGLPDLGFLIDRIPAAILALGMNSSAYQAEYFRGAIQSIDSGQMMAAKALGMTKKQAIKSIILPSIEDCIASMV